MPQNCSQRSTLRRLLALLTASAMLLAADLNAQSADHVNLMSAPSALSLNDASRALISNDHSLSRSRGISLPETDSVPEMVQPDQLWSAAQGKLLDGEALLLYLQRDDRLHGWLIVRGRPFFAFDRAVTSEGLKSLVDTYRKALSAGFDISARAPVARGAVLRGEARPLAISASAAAAQLARLLLPPEVAESSRDGIKHLTIVPAGDAALIPWSALPLDESGTLLIDRFSVSIAPGLSEFFRLSIVINGRRRGRSTGPLGLTKEAKAAVVGNPAFPADLPWRFPPLPGAEREAIEVARLLRTTALTGRAATKGAVSALLRERDVDLIYLATHGLADESQPLDGGFLVLASDPHRDAAEARWTAREVQTQRLRANLVVLSACQTGLGGIHAAGVIGIGRAFYIAGVPQVVTSLWSVDDDATAALMTDFVRNLEWPNDHEFFPAGALRRAMLNGRQRNSNPMLWASFITFGFPNVIWLP